MAGSQDLWPFKILGFLSVPAVVLRFEASASGMLDRCCTQACISALANTPTAMNVLTRKVPDTIAQEQTTHNSAHADKAQ